LQFKTHNLISSGEIAWKTTTTTTKKGAVPYQLSHQANWDLVTLWVCNIPIDGKIYNANLRFPYCIFKLPIPSWMLHQVMYVINCHVFPFHIAQPTNFNDTSQLFYTASSCHFNDCTINKNVNFKLWSKFCNNFC